MHTRYSQLLALSNKVRDACHAKFACTNTPDFIAQSPAQHAKSHPPLKAFALPSAGWFEASNDPAIMTQRLPLVQTFMQAVLTEAHVGREGNPALQILQSIPVQAAPKAE